MSIQIQQNKCTGCGQCIEACPGNLIKRGEGGKAWIRHIRDCWGCTSCLKECRFGAICFYLGADIGGRGSTLTVRKEGDVNIWSITDREGRLQQIRVDQKKANQY